MKGGSLVVILTAMASSAMAGVLGNYSGFSTYYLDSTVMSEASAITYRMDSYSFYVIGDEGARVFEYSRFGQVLSSMTLEGFGTASVGPEGLTYLGEGKFMIAAEPTQTAYEFTYNSGGMASRSAMKAHIFGDGTNIGNQGLEGIAYDHLTNSAWDVKELSTIAT